MARCKTQQGLLSLTGYEGSKFLLGSSSWELIIDTLALCFSGGGASAQVPVRWASQLGLPSTVMCKGTKILSASSSWGLTTANMAKCFWMGALGCKDLLMDERYRKLMQEGLKELSFVSKVGRADH